MIIATVLTGAMSQVRSCGDGEFALTWMVYFAGTSACPNGMFYCKNEGYSGATIRSSRVNDGLCELECCDGSDEAPGVCPDTCKEAGEEYRKKMEAEMKVRKTVRVQGLLWDVGVLTGYSRARKFAHRTLCLPRKRRNG